jgi:hypothetical protein
MPAGSSSYTGNLTGACHRGNERIAFATVQPANHLVQRSLWTLYVRSFLANHSLSRIKFAPSRKSQNHPKIKHLLQTKIRRRIGWPLINYVCTCEEALGGEERVALAGGERRGGRRASAARLDLLHSAHRTRDSLSSAPHRPDKQTQPIRLRARVPVRRIGGCVPPFPQGRNSRRASSRTTNTGYMHAFVQLLPELELTGHCLS